jgi:general stress protein CsbA
MFLIADAPAGRVIGLRSVAQLMAQRYLVGRTRESRALFNCPIILDRIIPAQVTPGVVAGVILRIIASKENNYMDAGTIQIIAAVLAVVLIGVIVMRRKGSKKKTDDDF